MKFEKLALRAKKIVDERGGLESLKADAAQLKNIAKGEGTMSEKAKAAAQAIKAPGADDEGATAPVAQGAAAPVAQDAAPPVAQEAAPAEPAPAAPTASPDLAAWAAGDDSAAQQ